MHSIDRNIFIGSSNDPQPIFRDQVTDAVGWPENAVMAITFTSERFSHLAPTAGEELPHTDYFGEDGWPVDLSPEIKATLPESIKREFQIQPWGWRQWGRWDWTSAREFPENFERARMLGPITLELVELTSKLCES